MRKEGAYFCKVHKDWIIGIYCGNGEWRIPGSNTIYFDGNFHTISPDPIPTPDQMISMEDSRIFIDNIVNNAWEGKDWNKIQDSLNYYDIILIPKN